MIKINLAPFEELENKYWFVPDLAFVVALTCVFYFSVDFYLGTYNSDSEQKTEETVAFTRNINNLKRDLKRYDELSKKINDLEFKILSLKSITVSKIARYKPIIILEHLQTLKPEGVWFKTIVDSSENEVIQITAGAFDNLLVSEFIANLESTKFQEADPTDLRTQVFFSETELDHVKIMSQSKSGGNQSVGKKIANNDEEEKKLKAEEKKLSILQKAFDDSQNKALFNPIPISVSSKSDSMYTELSTFPSFILRLAYKERGFNQPNSFASKKPSESENPSKGKK